MLTLLLAALIQTPAQAPAPAPAPVAALSLGQIIIDLAQTEFADEHIQHLATVPVVHQLNLAGTQVTDAGIAELAKFQNILSLSQLNLAGNTGITDAVIQHLQGLVNLREINLAGTKVTRAGLLRLRKALPLARIRR